MKQSSKILLTAMVLMLFSGVSFAQTASQKLSVGVMSKQSLKVEKLASIPVMEKGLAMEKSVYLIRVRSNDAHKTWHVQSELLNQGKPVLTGKMGEFTQKVEVIAPMGAATEKTSFYLTSEV